jgi:hypothetical protein
MMKAASATDGTAAIIILTIPLPRKPGIAGDLATLWCGFDS